MYFKNKSYHIIKFFKRKIHSFFWHHVANSSCSCNYFIAALNVVSHCTLFLVFIVCSCPAHFMKHFLSISKMLQLKWNLQLWIKMWRSIFRSSRGKYRWRPPWCCINIALYVSLHYYPATSRLVSTPGVHSTVLYLSGGWSFDSFMFYCDAHWIINRIKQPLQNILTNIYSFLFFLFYYLEIICLTILHHLKKIWKLKIYDMEGKNLINRKTYLVLLTF